MCVHTNTTDCRLYSGQHAHTTDSRLGAGLTVSRPGPVEHQRYHLGRLPHPHDLAVLVDGCDAVGAILQEVGIIGRRDGIAPAANRIVVNSTCCCWNGKVPVLMVRSNGVK